MKTLKIKRAQAATIPAGHIAIPVEHRLDASDIMNELFFDTLGSDGAPILQSAAAHIAGNHVRRERSTVA